MNNDYIVDYLFSQAEYAAYYKAIKPTLLSSISNKISSFFCSHKHYTLVKYELRRSTRGRDKNTSREYQYVRLALSQHHWKCARCGQRAELAQPIVPEPEDSLYDVAFPISENL